MSKLIKKLLFIIYLQLIILILLEIGVRLWGYSEHYIYDPIYMPYNKAADIPYVHKPNLENARARGLAIINTDSLGLRSKIAGMQFGLKKDNEYRSAIVGDSVAFGEGIKKTEDTFPQIIEDVLNKKLSNTRTPVFNYAVSAYSVKEMTATLKYRMLDIEPDLVIMAIIEGDFDLTRIPTIDERGYTCNYKMSGFVSKNSIPKRVLRGVHLTYVLRDIRYRWLNKNKNILNKTKENNLPESYRYIKQFKEISDKYNLPYIIVLLPSVSKQFESNILEQLEKDSITFTDLSFIRSEFTVSQFVTSKFDGHASSKVHKRIGEVLAENILKLSNINF